MKSKVCVRNSSKDDDSSQAKVRSTIQHLKIVQSTFLDCLHLRTLNCLFAGITAVNNKFFHTTQIFQVQIICNAPALSVLHTLRKSCAVIREYLPQYANSQNFFAGVKAFFFGCVCVFYAFGIDDDKRSL